MDHSCGNRNSRKATLEVHSSFEKYNLGPLSVFDKILRRYLVRSWRAEELYSYDNFLARFERSIPLQLLTNEHSDYGLTEIANLDEYF